MFELKLDSDQLKNLFSETLQEYFDTRRSESSIVWLRSSDVREMLNISDSTLQTLRQNGTIPSYKLGTIWYYKKEEIHQIIEDGLFIN